jgi:hypothetical protein
MARGNNDDGVAKEHQTSLEGHFKSESDRNSLLLLPLPGSNPVIAIHITKGTDIAATDVTIFGMSSL